MEPTKTENPPSFPKQYEIHPKNNQLIKISLSVKHIKKSCDRNRAWRLEMLKFKRAEFTQN